MKMIRKFCLILACIFALFSVAAAEEAPVYQIEDFAGEWQLSIIVESGQHMNLQAWGIIVTLNLNEDGTAFMDYGDDNPTEMSWRFEDGRAFITGYSAEGEIEMSFYEDGSLRLADEIGEMYFLRPVEEAA